MMFVTPWEGFQVARIPGAKPEHAAVAMQFGQQVSSPALTCCIDSGVGDDVIDRCGDEMPRKLASRRVRPRRVTSPGESGRSSTVPRGSVRLRFALW